jgi:hypothetical protein
MRAPTRTTSNPPSETDVEAGDGEDNPTDAIHDQEEEEEDAYRDYPRGTFVATLRLGALRLAHAVNLVATGDVVLSARPSIRKGWVALLAVLLVGT